MAELRNQTTFRVYSKGDNPKASQLITMGKRGYSHSSNSTFKKSRYNGVNRAMQSKLLRNLVNKQIVAQQEKKEYQMWNLGTVYGGNTTNNYVNNLTGNIIEGVDANQRIGRQIAHHHLTVDYSVAFTPTTTAVMQDWGFIAVVLDRQPQGTATPPTFDQIFDISTGCPAGMAPRITLDFKDRFTILANRPWAVAFASGSAPVHDRIYVDLAKVLKGRDRTATFRTGGTTPDHGSILLVVAGSNTSTTASGATQGPRIQTMCKYVFTDA